MPSLIPDRFFERVREHPSRPAYADVVRFENRPQWRVADWQTYGEQVKSVAAAFISLGLQPGDRVAILASNRSEWTIADLAAMTIGAVPLGVYASCPDNQVEYILAHSQARLVIAEDRSQRSKILSVRPRLPMLEHIVTLDASSEMADTLQWSTLNRRITSADLDEVDRRRADLELDDLATLVYTSGTTGRPKAVMLTHRNLLAATAMGLEAMAERRPDDVLLSYLPLAHVAERGMSVLGPAAAGYSVYFCPRMEWLPACLQSVRPTVFLGVPRVWEKMREAIVARAAGSPLKKPLLEWALTRQGKVGAAVADALVFRRIRAALGLDRAHTVVCGAAPVDDHVIDFFARIGVEVRKIYGLSECSGPATITRKGADWRDNVGTPFSECEVRIGDAGEILIRGPHVFRGYLGDSVATELAIPDGWLRTGDLGTLNPDGTLTVTGRAKDLIITSGGKNITPSEIEHALSNHPAICDAMIVGDRRPYLTALLTLIPDARTTANEIEIERHVRNVNENFARAQQVKKFAILDATFSVESGELTPTRKLRRSVITEKYKREIDSMYSHGEVVVERILSTPVEGKQP